MFTKKKIIVLFLMIYLLFIGGPHLTKQNHLKKQSKTKLLRSSYWILMVRPSMINLALFIFLIMINIFIVPAQ